MLCLYHVLSSPRCVAENQRTLALGIQSCIFRLIGTIPGPILFGVVFDSSCLFWQEDCGRRGNCWVYDNSSLSIRALILAVGGMLAYVVFVFLCWLVYPRQPKTSKKKAKTSKKKAMTSKKKDGIPLEQVEGTANGGETGVLECSFMNTEIEQPKVD